MDFKKEALLFDKLAVDMLGWHMRNITIWPEPEMNDFQKAKELEWLMENDVIFEPPIHEKYPSPLVKEAYDEQEKIMEEYYEINNLYYKTHGPDDTNWSKPSKSLKSHIEQLCNICYKGIDPLTRLRAIELKKCEDALVYPILYSTDSYLNKAATKGQILQIILNKLPVPSLETEWRSILDYKEDPETKIRRSGLWTWATEVSRGELTPKEVEDKLRWELNQYEKHIEHHRMKSRLGKIEIISLTIADVAENLVRFKFGKIARTLFQLAHKEANLLEAEMGAPGKKLSYITKTREKFN